MLSIYTKLWTVPQKWIVTKNYRLIKLKFVTYSFINNSNFFLTAKIV